MRFSHHTIAASFWVFSGVLAGRVSGFVREILIASRFGASETADILITSLIIPIALTGLLMGGALSKVLIPEFQFRHAASQKKLFRTANWKIGLGFAFFTLLLSFQASWIAALFNPQLSDGALTTTAELLRWTLWALPLSALAGITTARLQALHHFAIPALGPLLYNLALISVLLYGLIKPELSAHTLLFWLAVAAVAGGLLRYGSQLLTLWLLPSPAPPTQPPAPSSAPSTRSLPPIHHRYAQALLSASILLLLPLIARFYAGMEGTGSYALFHYALRLIELPAGLFLTLLPISLFPSLSERFADSGKQDTAISLARNAMLMTGALGILFGTLLFLSPEPFVAVIYGYGAMDAEALHQTAYFTRWMALALPAWGLLSLTESLFLARRDTQTPFRLGISVLVLLLLCGKPLYLWFGLEGMLTGFVLTYWILLAAHLHFLRRHGLEWPTLLPIRALLRLLLRVLPVMLIACWAAEILPSLYLRVACLLTGTGLAIVLALTGLREGQSILHSFYTAWKTRFTRS